MTVAAVMTKDTDEGHAVDMIVIVTTTTTETIIAEDADALAHGHTLTPDRAHVPDHIPTLLHLPGPVHARGHEAEVKVEAGAEAGVLVDTAAAAGTIQEVGTATIRHEDTTHTIASIVLTTAVTTIVVPLMIAMIEDIRHPNRHLARIGIATIKIRLHNGLVAPATHHPGQHPKNSTNGGNDRMNTTSLQ